MLFGRIARPEKAKRAEARYAGVGLIAREA